MGELSDGVLIVDKEEGETSFSVVRKVKKLLKVSKVGHAGTLDPFATGLLLVLVGQGTKLSPYLMAGDKTYLGTLALGTETDTLDRTGRVTAVKPVPKLDPELIREKARAFVGETEQTPPSFSALKVQGKRAYSLARKGLPVTLEKRRVRIMELAVLSLDLPDVTFRVVCSSGTYVRTLAADLGKELGVGAHLKALRRTAIGPYGVEDALRSGDMGASAEAVKKRIIPLRHALPHFTEVEVDERTAFQVRKGYQPGWEELGKKAPFPQEEVKLVSGTDLVALVRYEVKAKGGLRVSRVFV
ncbi:MAG TPA: tRNA pseudouridine(55) synthase TruB [Desulfatiglandales bacterium]|nr:tRNA pseudouridine(55) synthase TruB [Desulfatiglandales bacterium]